MNIYVYDQATGLKNCASLEDLKNFPEDSVVWVDICTNDLSDLVPLAEHFDLHELAVEDCLTPGHFPKLEDFGERLFIILRSLSATPLEEAKLEDEDDDIYTRKISIFVSKNFVISHRRYEVSWLDAVVRQVKQHPEATIALGTDALLHRIVDVLVDRFERSLDVFDDKIDAMEDAATADPDDFEMSQILEIKQELVQIRQIARTQRMVISQLTNNPNKLIAKSRRRYFKDIDDHALSLVNTLDKLIDNVRGLRDVYFAFSNVRLGDTMRILAVITTVLAPMEVLVGLYGMNFEAMPLLHNPNGFWVMLVVLLGVSGSLLYYFRKRHWL